VLVQPANPQDLARGICRLLGDPHYAREMGRRGRAKMLDQFTLERTSTDLARLYRKMLANDNRRPVNSGNIVLRLVVLAGVCAYIALRIGAEELSGPRLRTRPD
jgi:hypothetical protein